VMAIVTPSVAEARPSLAMYQCLSSDDESSSLALSPCSQFHKYFTISFCADILMPTNYKAKL